MLRTGQTSTVKFLHCSMDVSRADENRSRGGRAAKGVSRSGVRILGGLLMTAAIPRPNTSTAREESSTYMGVALIRQLGMQQSFVSPSNGVSSANSSRNKTLLSIRWVSATTTDYCTCRIGRETALSRLQARTGYNTKAPLLHEH